MAISTISFSQSMKHMEQNVTGLTLKHAALWVCHTYVYTRNDILHCVAADNNRNVQELHGGGGGA
eukprot:6324039-Amphidinium_carterae.1